MNEYNINKIEEDGNNLIINEETEEYGFSKEGYEEYERMCKLLEEAEENLKNNNKMYTHKEVMNSIKKIMEY